MKSVTMTEAANRPTQKQRLIIRMIAVILITASVFSSVVIWHSTKASAAGSSQVSSAISWAVSTANNNSHGYSQSNRYGNPDYDCSSFVSSAFQAAGFNVSAGGSTSSMKSQFTAAGFSWIPRSSVGSLQAGDILLDESQHVELYIGNGQNVAAHRDYGSPAGGDQSGKEISVTSYYNFDWDGVLRYETFDVDASVSCSPSNGALAGTSVKLTVNVNGSTSGLTYKFLAYDESTGDWETIRDYSSSNTTSWYTGSAGNKIIYVDVKNSSGQTDRVQTSYKVYANPLKADRFFSRDGTRVGTGKTIRLSAASSGGTESYTYKFMIYNKKTKNWDVIRDFATAASCVWNAGDAGEKTLRVDVKDSSGNVEHKTLSFSVK